MLTEEQRAALTARAQRDGIDPAALIKEAESMSAATADKPAKEAKPGKPEPGAVKPNLFMYLLPFVTVNEVRTIWLELPAQAGGDMNAAKYAAEQLGTGAKPPESAE